MPDEQHDIPMDIVLSERRILRSRVGDPPD
jgi:5-formyltetrahydrofolate cyclo-ligase